jgi:Arc/MetJ family transcription regulator
MDRSIDIPDDLVKAAQEATGEADERDAVAVALKDWVASKRSRAALEGMLELAGKIQLRDDYDYKALRAGGQHDHDH